MSDELDPNFSLVPSVGNPNTLPAPIREPTILDVLLAIAEVRQDIAALRSDLAVTFSADEFDPKRQKMSNELAEKVLTRLAAEQAVRDKYGYTITGNVK